MNKDILQLAINILKAQTLKDQIYYIMLSDFREICPTLEEQNKYLEEAKHIIHSLD